jgi:hypothetical protein
MLNPSSPYDVQLATAMLAARRAEADRERLLALAPRRPGGFHGFAGSLLGLLARRAPAPATTCRPGPTARVCCPAGAA